MRYRVLSVRTIAVWAVLIMAVGVGMAVWLLLAYTGGDADANRVQLDAIRTAGTIVVGTGGAAALLLAARRQRTAEIALKQKDRDQADVARAHVLQVQVAEQTRQHQERVAAVTEADAAARRITDLYTKAVEQLGSEKAPVRLGGLYALERLAQDHVEQRQTIVNVLCAYLRMPYTLPGHPPADNADDKLVTAHRERVQESEVRIAAQRLLAHHLRPGDDSDNLIETFWDNLDLTGATLINFSLDRCTLRHARFDKTTFTGVASFIQATFTRGAWFGGASFNSRAWFRLATLTDNTAFDHATFADDAWFTHATFARDAWFGWVTFTRGAWFDEVTFTGNTRFGEATFNGNTDFSGATLPSTRFTDYDTPQPWTNFAGARFERKVPPEVAEFVSSPDEETRDEATG